MLPKDVIAKLRRLEIRTGRIVNEIFAGQYESVFKGRGMEFSEVREYFPGDDVRSIDWNVTARMGHPYVKKFVEERELTILLAVDASASTAFGTRSQAKADLAAELSGVLAYTAVKNHDRVGALLFTDRVEQYIPPATGSSHLSRILRDVLYARPQGRGTDLNPALDFLNEVLKRRAIVFLISDFYAPDHERALAVTNKRHDVIACEVHDPGEALLPPIGWLAVEDAEGERSRLVWAGSEAARRAFAAAATAEREQIRERFRRLGVDHIELSTDRSYVEPLLKFFRMRARRFR